VTDDALLAEMEALRERVSGITGSAIASRDGLSIREDTGGPDADNLAALAAPALAVAQRLASEAGQGTLRETLTRSTGGYVAVYAVGARAVLILIGDEGLDITRLHRESRATVESMEKLLGLRLLRRHGRARWGRLALWCGESVLAADCHSARLAT
jgi:uncharacterized protein